MKNPVRIRENTIRKKVSAKNWFAKEEAGKTKLQLRQKAVEIYYVRRLKEPSCCWGRPPSLQIRPREERKGVDLGRDRKKPGKTTGEEVGGVHRKGFKVSEGGSFLDGNLKTKGGKFILKGGSGFGSKGQKGD